jgi:non-heme chloroperoxidase
MELPPARLPGGVNFTNGMPYVQTNDSRFGEPVSIFYQDWGGASNPAAATSFSATNAIQPTVVLIHGWPLSHEMWDYQMTALAERGLRVVAYDRRGFGKSSKPWGGYDYDTFADDLKALIDELNLDNVVLVGFSMGGGEVARYFSRHGGAKVSKAVLISAVTPFLLKTDGNPDGVDKETFDTMVENLRADRADFLQTFGKQFYGVGMLSKPVSQAHLDGDFFRAYLASPKATLDCVRAFSETDFRDEMQTINVPTLIIHGDSDKTVPIEASGERTADLLPTANYLVYGDAPHGLFITEKDRLTQDLLLFVLEGRAENVPVGEVTY